MEKKTIKGYKGFNPDMTCRGFQYEIGKEYETEKAKACEQGFHFCEYPLDVLGYYEPSTEKGMNRFCEVEGSGDFDESESDKVACTKIKIKAEIGIIGLVNAAVEYIKSKVDWKDNKESNTGNRSAATNTGDYSAATNTGNRSAATNTGNRSAATNTGYYSAATNTGDYSAATNTGDYSAATNTGNRSASEVTGKESVAIVTGKNCKARGTIGNWLVLTERGDWDGSAYPIKEVRAFKVDGIEIKENVFYKLIDGKAVECE